MLNGLKITIKGTKIRNTKIVSSLVYASGRIEGKTNTGRTFIIGPDMYDRVTLR